MYEVAIRPADDHQVAGGPAFVGLEARIASVGHQIIGYAIGVDIAEHPARIEIVNSHRTTFVTKGAKMPKFLARSSIHGAQLTVAPGENPRLRASAPMCQRRGKSEKFVGGGKTPAALARGDIHGESTTNARGFIAKSDEHLGSARAGEKAWRAIGSKVQFHLPSDPCRRRGDFARPGSICLIGGVVLACP